VKKLISFIIIVLFSCPVFAQDDIPFLEERPGEKEGRFYTLEGAVIGDPITIDAAFAEIYQTQVPLSPFSIIVPRDQNRRMSAGGAGGQYASIGYFSDDGAAREIVRLTSLTIPEGEPSARLAVLIDLMLQEGPKLAFSGWEQGQFEGIFKTRIGGRYDAVTMQGWCSDPGKGYYFARLCGVLNPEGREGILAFVLIDPDLMGIEPSELISKGETLKIIHSIEFLAD
jgi:hypothetical protein